MNIIKKLLSDYLKYKYEHTDEEFISIFLRKDIMRKLLDEAVKKCHWYVAKYLLRFGAGFIVFNPQIEKKHYLYPSCDNPMNDFLTINRNEYLLTYILDNSVFSIGDIYDDCNRENERDRSYFDNRRSHGDVAYLSNGGEASMNRRSQIKKYLIYLRHKMIFIHKLSYPVD